MSNLSQLPYLGIRYQIKFHRCNLDCPYCIADWKQKQDMSFDLKGFQAALAGIRELPYRVSLRIGVGGELFLNKEILDCIRELCNGDNNLIGVSFSTNMATSWKKTMKPFFDSVDVRKLGIGCTLHDSVIRDIDGFFDKIALMREYGIALYVGYVALPDRIPEIRTYKKRCDKLGVPLSMNGLYGKMVGAGGETGNKIYPRDYTASERSRLKELWDTPHSYLMQIEEVKTLGMPCSAGRNYIYLHTNGDISPCGNQCNQIIGNLFDPKIRLLDEDSICPIQTCSCGNENQALRIIDEKYDRAHVLRLFTAKPGISEAELYAGYQASTQE